MATPYALIVNGNTADSELLHDILKEAAVQGIMLADIPTAADLVRKQVFDLVFVDMIGGIELARLIRGSEGDHRTPIVLLCDNPEASVTRIAFQSGITFVLHKPLSRDKVLNLLRVATSRSLVEKRRFQRVRVRRAVEIQCGESASRGHTEDISLNGLLVRVPTVFPLGSRLNVNLQLPAGPIATRGLLTRISPVEELGIHLDTLTRDHSQQLQDFLLPLITAQ